MIPLYKEAKQKKILIGLRVPLLLVVSSVLYDLSRDVAMIILYFFVARLLLTPSTLQQSYLQPPARVYIAMVHLGR